MTILPDGSMTDTEYSQAQNDFGELNNEDNTNHAEEPQSVDVVIYEDEDIVVKTEYEEPLKKEGQKLEEEAELGRKEDSSEREKGGSKREKVSELERELKEEELKREVKEEVEDEEPDINPQMFLSVEQDLPKAEEENDGLPLPSTKVLLIEIISLPKANK